MDGWMDGWKDGRMDGWVDGWMEVGCMTIWSVQCREHATESRLGKSPAIANFLETAGPALALPSGTEIG